nr:dysbindin domain-containing protein 1 isoform X1 [Loxodonta africana]
MPQAALGVPAHSTGGGCHTPVAEEEVGVPIPAPGLLQVTERRQPLSSVSSLEVHFDLLDLTELTDMSDQELAEVFADSDDENLANDSPAGGVHGVSGSCGSVAAVGLLMGLWGCQEAMGCWGPMGVSGSRGISGDPEVSEGCGGVRGA